MTDTETFTLGMRPTKFYGLRQKDVEQELERRFPQQIDNETLLDVYTSWLVKHIPYLRHHSHMHSSETIRKGCNYLGSRNYSKGVVLSAFSKHKNSFLKDRPKDIRAFNLARRDIEINYKVPPGLPPKLHSSFTPNVPTFSQTQPSLETPGTQETRETQIELNYLNPSNQQSLLVHLGKHKSDTQSSAKRPRKTPVRNSSENQMPPANYVCKRCGIPGHFVKQCHTNGNPLYDQPPPKGYICAICGAARTHLVHNCPRYVADNVGGTSPDRGPITSVSNINLRGSSGERFNMPSEEAGIVSSQVIVVPFDSDTARRHMSFPMERLGEIDNLSSARRARSTSMNRASELNDDYMNMERVRYIQSHTENSRAKSQDPLAPTGGPLRSGSNMKPIGHRRRLDSYRPLGSHRADDSYRPDDFYRPNESRRHDISDRQDETRSMHHEDEPRRHKNSDRRDGSRRSSDSSHADRSERRDLTDFTEKIRKGTAGNKETKYCSIPKRKRSDGRLSPWDDIHPPTKKRRQQDPPADGLPWNDIETLSKKHQRYLSSYPAVKQDLNVSHRSRLSPEPKQCVSGEDDAMEPGEVTNAEWKQAGIEADAFLDAFGRELVECQKLGALTSSQVAGGSERPLSSPVPSASYADQPHYLEDPALVGDDDVFMSNAPKEVAGSTRNPSKMAEHPPHSASVTAPSLTLKPLQRDPPYDHGVLNLFRGKEHEHAYVNVARRSTAIEMYEETEKECATTKMSHLTV